MNRMRSVYGLAVGLCFGMGIWACTSTLDFNSVSTNADGGTKKDSGTQPSGDDDDSSTGDDGGTGGTFCAQAANKSKSFCDDFDGKDIGEVWDGTEFNSNGAVTDDDVSAFSKPKSLLSKTSAITATGEGVRAVAKKAFSNFDGKAITVSVEFEMNVQSFDQNSGALMTGFAMLLGQDNDYVEIVMNVKSTGTGVVLQVAESGQNPDGGTPYALHGPFTARPKVNGWSKIKFEVDIKDVTGTTGNQLRFYVDDARQVNDSLKVPMKAATPRMELGVGWAQAPSDAWSVRYDNFTADVSAL